MKKEAGNGRTRIADRPRLCVCGVAGFPIIVGNVYYISHFDWQREKDGGQFHGRQQFGNDEIFFVL